MVLEKVRRSLARHGAFVPGEKVIVAVSGGCDSVALLHLLKRSREFIKLDLHVASLNHGLRAEAGQRDLDFVAGLAARWGLPHTVGQADIPRRAQEWGIGIEEAARRARYAFLARVAREEGSACVAAGHHALDQAETIIMNIARGSGITGLRGMDVVAQIPDEAGLRLVRPLLQLTKADLESYCQRHKLPYRLDESNADISYQRNFVRHQLIGPMLQLNPELLSAFARLAESAAVEDAYVSSQFERAALPFATVSEERWSIPVDEFAALHPALQRRFVRGAYQRLSGSGQVLSHALTLDLVAWAQQAGTGARRDMSAAIQMRLSYAQLSIERKSAVEAHDDYCLIPAGTDEHVDADTPLVLPNMRLCLSRAETAGSEDLALWLRDGLELRLRTRRPGDRFKPNGMGGRSRKLKDWMIDRKIPRAIRDQIPLLCADGEIIAICLGDFWRLAHSDLTDQPGARRYSLTVG
ncbi:MAG: tRNA lysidine(34) synthetase TilS [Chloroflexi bacterium]|nr:tRNA lysidine(34) synthetase TilS [Chloroflexota bacterium]